VCPKNTYLKHTWWPQKIAALLTSVLNGIHTRVRIVGIEICTAVQMLYVVGSIWMNGCAVGAVRTVGSPQCCHELCKTLLAYVLILLHLCRPVTELRLVTIAVLSVCMHPLTVYRTGTTEACWFSVPKLISRTRLKYFIPQLKLPPPASA
jgi:hypothetical protein